MPIEGVLAGLRVVELSAFVAAPFASATLAALGADVIRVEQRGGGIDANRWPVHQGRSLYRAGLDRGKRSLTVDLRSDPGQELVADLIRGGGEGGGIVVTNLGAQGWMAFDRLAAGRPDLIMVLIKGSPEGRTAVDYTVNAGLGFPFVTGPEGQRGPVNHVLPAWDVTTGALAALAVVAADRRRRQTGRGGLVEIALSEVALEVTRALGYLDEARLVAEPRGRFGNYLYGTYARDFTTADGRSMMVCALTPRQWQALVDATGAQSAIEELEARTGADLRREGDRFLHREAISGPVGAWIRGRGLAAVAAEFDARGVLWGPYRTFKELLEAEPALAASRPSPLAFAGVDSPPPPPAPEIGADTESILRDELGLGPAEIERLRAAGVVD